MNLARKKWEFSRETAEVPGQRQVTALMASTHCLLSRAPEISGCFAAVELSFRPLRWALQPSHLHTDRQIELQSFTLKLGPGSFSGFTSWGVSSGRLC